MPTHELCFVRGLSWLSHCCFDTKVISGLYHLCIIIIPNKS